MPIDADRCRSDIAPRACQLPIDAARCVFEEIIRTTKQHRPDLDIRDAQVVITVPASSSGLARVDLLISDDGLQHRALARDAELMVFYERGIGNGLLLPAGPLREPLAAAQGRQVLYTSGHASTALPGTLALRSIDEAWPLQAWHQGAASAALPLSSLAGRPLLAVAGLAAPEKFFGMLAGKGLSFQPCPLPDHHPYATLPWPADTANVITTEKDAIKLDAQHIGTARVWVVPLDLQLPSALVRALLTLLPRPTTTASAP